MIKEIRALTGLSYQQLGAWLGVSKSMVQFAEFGERSLRGDAAKKLLALAPVIQQLKKANKAASKAQTVPAARAAKMAGVHRQKMEQHQGLAQQLQYRLHKLQQQHSKLTARFALLQAMSKLDTEVYSSTQTDNHIATLLESFGRDQLEKVAAKLEPLQGKIILQHAFAEAHKKLAAKYDGLKAL